MDVSSPAPVRLSGRWLLALFGLTFGLAMALAIYTQNAWEDWYITFRASKNLALGHGLVFTPGEYVHSFTSPLGVLIPAGLSAAVGNQADDLVLWLFRIISAVCLGATAVLLARLGMALKLTLWPMILLLGAFVLDGKSLQFSTNGMETGLLLLAVILVLHGFWKLDRRNFWQLGAAWALLMWVRPDGCVYIAGISAGLWLFGFRNAGISTRWELLRCLFLAGLVTTVLYLPWFLWAWWFYGSPVPHTITAKGGMNDAAPFINRVIDMLRFPFISLTHSLSFDALYTPAEAVSFGGWHPAALWVSKIAGWLAAFYWLMPRTDGWARGLSFGLFILNLYFCFIMNTLYPWYIPPATMITTLLLAMMLQRALMAKPKPWLPPVLKGVVVAFVVYVAGLSLAGAYHTHWRQVLIEDGLRRHIGLWLNENASSPKDTVYVECLGYVGFFSQLKMLDWPGLSSPEVVAARAKHKTENWEVLIRELRPDWLVLRDHEADLLTSRDPDLLNGPYREVKRFDREPDVNAIAWMPGRMYFILDDTFVIYQRQPSQGDQAGAPESPSEGTEGESTR